MRLWESLSLPGKKESVKNKEGHYAGVENKNLNTKRDKDILWDHKTTAAILCNSYYFLYVILLFNMVNRSRYTSHQRSRTKKPNGYFVSMMVSQIRF